MSDETKNPNNRIVFGVSMEGQGDDVPLVILGIPGGAWHYMRDGKTHTFGLTSIGVPVKLMLFGAVSYADALDTLKKWNESLCVLTVDMRDRDFSIYDDDCSSCGEEMPLNECPKSKRACGHHCNHSWTADECCWCGKQFGEQE